MSSLDTLLEAAKFVECSDVDSNENDARAPDPPEFHHYAKPAPTLKRTNSESDKSDTNDEARSNKKHAGAGTREVHNKLEKNRRAHLKECFDNLKQQVPNLENHNKVSNLSILRGAYKYILILKRRESDLQQEYDPLECEKVAAHVRLSMLKKDLSDMNVDISPFLQPQNEDTCSVSTATAHNESPIMSDVEEEVEVTTTPMPHSSGRQLSFHNMIVTTPVKTTTSTTVASTFPVQTDVKPVFAIPLSALKGAHTHGNVGTNHKTIAAMLNTSGQSQLNENLGGTKLGVAVTNKGNANMTANIQQPYPVSLLHAGSLSLVTNQQNVLQTNAPNNLSQQHIKVNAKNQVNEILQKTITQRVQLQQLQKLQQQQQPQQMSASLILASNHATVQSPTITVSQAAGSGPQVITMNASALRPIVSSLKTLPQIQQAIALNQMLPSAFTLGNQALLTSSVSTPSTTVNSQPIAVATLNTVATTTMTTSTVTLSTARNATLINQLAGLANNSNVSAAPTITSLSGLNLATMKPILTMPINQLAGAQLVSQQVTTLQQLLSQAAANKSTQLQGAGLTVSTAPETVTGPTVLTPALPATQVGQVTGNLSQFLPISVVAQGVGQGVTLNSTNITNTALNAQVLKSLGLPILQHSFSLPVKPIVMVSMANVGSSTAATSTSQTLRLNLPVTQS